MAMRKARQLTSQLIEQCLGVLQIRGEAFGEAVVNLGEHRTGLGRSSLSKSLNRALRRLRCELLADQERFLRHWFEGTEDEILDEPPVRIFVMGDNRWRDEREWPLARTQYTKVYLRGRGRANSLRGDGALKFEEPADEPADQYTYDPDNPVPTRGGTTLGLAPGVFDQRDVEERDDVLVYTGDVLPNDLEVTGPITMMLQIA